MTDINLPRRVWVDVHAAGSITAGAALRLQNKGEMPVYLAVAASAPTLDPAEQPDGWTLERFGSVDAVPGAGLKLWAVCTAGDAQLFAELATGGVFGSSVDLDGVMTELNEINQDTIVMRADLANLVGATVGYDSLGALLPADFNSRPRSFTYDANGNLQTEVVSKAPNTWTKTYTYTGLNLTAISAWVKA